MANKCKLCSRDGHSVYHYDGCPIEKGGKTPWLWIPDSERPIEKADRYLMQSGMEKKGAKGWI